MAYRFSPPTVTDAARFRADADEVTRRLWGHMAGDPKGKTVLKTGATYTECEFPYSDDIDAADIAYLGGHIYEVDATEKAALEAAGYTVETVG